MSRRQYRVRRIVRTIPVVANGFDTIDLPRDYDYESIHLRLYGGVQVTVNATSVRAEAPTQAIKRIEILSDGKNAIYTAPFWYSVLGNVDRQGGQSGARATTPPSAATTATYQVEACGTIDMATIRGLRAKDSNFRSAGLSIFQLRAIFGAAGDLFVGGTSVFDGMQLEVSVTQMTELPDPADGTYFQPPFLRKVSYQEQTFAASNPNAEIRLPAGNLLSRVYFRAEGASTAGEPSTAVLNNISLQAGLDVRFNMSAAGVRALNNADYGQMVGGHYVADLLSQGLSLRHLSDLWDVTGAAEPKAVIDVTGGANVRVQSIIEEYLPAVRTG